MTESLLAAESNSDEAPNDQVETNRCQTSQLRSWQVIWDRFRVYHGPLTAAVAHLKRSALPD